jgi:hypothetical protein
LPSLLCSQTIFSGEVSFRVTTTDVETPLPPLGEPGLDLAGLADGELIRVMAEARRLASHAQALELAAVAELVERREAEDQMGGVEVISASEYVHDEIAEALTLTATSADDLIRFATDLRGRLPGTFAALAAGDIDYAKARTVWHGTAQVSDAVAAAIEERVLPKAPHQTTGQIRAKIRRLVKRLDPDALARRCARAQSRHDVQLIETDDDTAHLSGLDLPADAATAAYNRLSAIAAACKTDGDERAIPQLRADAFLALLTGTLTTPSPATTTDRAQSDGTTAQMAATPDHPVTVTLTGTGSAHHPATDATIRTETGWTETDDAIADLIAGFARDHLTHLTDHLTSDHLTSDRLATDRLTGDPGRDEVPERHQNPAQLITHAAERIAASLADLKTGWCVPDHGQYGYRVPAGMRRLIEDRDKRCCFPACRRPVKRCDADHSLPFQSGGPTCPCNIAMLCRYHHRMKQSPQWRIVHLWPGVILWITPTGHWRIIAPADRE